MANTSAIWQQAHIPPTICHLLAAQQEPYKKSLTLNGKMLKNFLEMKSEEWTISRKVTRPKEQEDQAEKQERLRGW